LWIFFIERRLFNDRRLSSTESSLVQVNIASLSTTDFDDKESKKSRLGKASRRGRCVHWKVIEASIAIPLSSISNGLANVTLNKKQARSRVGQ
jgi:hypothetical protein